jgi:hypothetical protein
MESTTYIPYIIFNIIKKIIKNNITNLLSLGYFIKCITPLIMFIINENPKIKII